MAWNTIYYGNFNDNVNQDRIDIYIKQKDYVGTSEQLTLDENPLVITYPKKEFYDQLFGCGCNINIINKSSDFFHYDSLFSYPERNNYIEIIKTLKDLDSSIFLFQGYILPQMYSSTLEKNIKLTISTTDQLNELENHIPIIFVDISTYRSDEYENAFDIISNILSDTDITNKILIHNTLENINYHKDASSTVFDNIFFCADNFADSNNIQNDNICLEKILSSFYSRCFYHDGKWMIERVSDLGKDNKAYVLYEKDASSMSWDVSNNRINLSSNNYIISGTPSFTFNPGYQKISLKLNYKEPQSLVENYYYDFQYFDSSNASSTGKPLPAYRKWMMSSTDSSISASTFVSGKINNGLWFFVDVWGTMVDRYNWFKTQFASTMFQFTPITSKTELDISFKHELSPYMVEGLNDAERLGTGLNAKFALRSCDINGKSWWVAKSGLNDTSTYWSDSIYTFNSSIGWNDVVDTNYVWEIKETIDITSPIFTDVSICTARKRIGGWSWETWEWTRKKWVTYTYEVPTTPQYIGQLYLDIYPLLRNAPAWYWPTGGYFPYYTWFGDVDVDIKTEIPYNILEASIGYFNSIKELSLDIFDVSTIMFTNGIYNLDASLNIRSILKWRDKDLDNYILLQDKYIEDLSQMLWYPRYSLDVDIKSLDSSVWHLGNLFTHNSIKYPDGSIMEFMCNGLAYNVKENSYRLNLLEYIDDDNWRVDPLLPDLYLDPSYYNFAKIGGNIDISVFATSGNTWTATDTCTWLSLTNETSTGNGQFNIICAQQDDGNISRSGRISVTSSATIKYVDITQDASKYVSLSKQGSPPQYLPSMTWDWDEYGTSYEVSMGIVSTEDASITGIADFVTVVNPGIGTWYEGNTISEGDIMKPYPITTNETYADKDGSIYITNNWGGSVSFALKQLAHPAVATGHIYIDPNDKGGLSLGAIRIVEVHVGDSSVAITGLHLDSEQIADGAQINPNKTELKWRTVVRNGITNSGDIDDVYYLNNRDIYTAEYLNPNTTITWADDVSIFLSRTPILYLSSASTNFTKLGGDINVDVSTTTMNYWIATDSCDWINIVNETSTGNGQFTIQCSQQVDEGAARSGRIYVDSSAAQKTFDVYQDASLSIDIVKKAPPAYIYASTWQHDKYGQTYEVSFGFDSSCLGVNYDASISDIPSWIYLRNPADVSWNIGDTIAVTDIMKPYPLAANDTSAYKTGNITLVNNYGGTESWMVMQNGIPVPLVDFEVDISITAKPTSPGATITDVDPSAYITINTGWKYVLKVINLTDTSIYLGGAHIFIEAWSPYGIITTVLLNQDHIMPMTMIAPYSTWEDSEVAVHDGTDWDSSLNIKANVHSLWDSYNYWRMRPYYDIGIYDHVEIDHYKEVSIYF
jgi:hypothetical protein